MKIILPTKAWLAQTSYRLFLSGSIK